MTKPNFDDLEIYEMLLGVCTQYGADPSASIESEAFFRTLLLQFEGDFDRDKFQAWLHEEIPKQFVSIGKRPKWIQGYDWPVRNGKPMIFVGQLDISLRDAPNADQFFHDDTSFYVFIEMKGETEVIMQQY